MPTYNDEQKRDMYKDMAAKQHLAMRLARSRRTFACDALEEETVEDYCKRMLEKLGLRASGDPVAALTMFLHGHEHGAQSSAGGGQSAGMDAASGTLQGADVDKFFASLVGR